MNGRLLISLAFVGAVGLAGAYALGLFDRPEPARPLRGAAVAPPPSRPAPVEPAEPAAPEEPAEPAVSASPAPESAPTTATLRIDSDVRGADVFIDNRFVGRTPAVVENLIPGPRKINVSADGYETAGGFHEIAAGSSELMIRVRTIRLDRRVAVTHRHRAGSCEGTLSATADGLRYETSRTEDAFDVALTALQTFTADFLRRSLEVRAGGRTYDFTVPDDRVDDLYAFYQEVEKVRQRLIEERNGGD